MNKNFEEKDYSIAHFHIGKGGRFNNPGHETFVALEDLSRVISKSDVTLINQDEEETEDGEEIMVIRSFSSAVPDYYIFND